MGAGTSGAPTRRRGRPRVPLPGSHRDLDCKAIAMVLTGFLWMPQQRAQHRSLTGRPVGMRGLPHVDASLLGLLEDLVEAFERRETAEPGDRIGRVTARIRRLELQIAERLEQDRHRGTATSADARDRGVVQAESDATGSVA